VNDDGLSRFAEEWESVLNVVVARRMRAVGVPDSMIGIHGMPYEDPGAFVRTHAVGGSNNNIPDRGIMGDRPGINVDIAVLDVAFPPMLKVVSWSEGRLKDRIDAVIAHEYTEVLSTGLPVGRTPHQYAVQAAPETSLKITEGARRILRDYRRIEGLE
jgi:hypothetical protein